MAPPNPGLKTPAGTPSAPEPEYASPLGPLMWLLIPFVGIIAYGLFTK